LTSRETRFCWKWLFQNSVFNSGISYEDFKVCEIMYFQKSNICKSCNKTFLGELLHFWIWFDVIDIHNLKSLLIRNIIWNYSIWYKRHQIVFVYLQVVNMNFKSGSAEACNQVKPYQCTKCNKVFNSVLLNSRPFSHWPGLVYYVLKQNSALAQQHQLLW